VSFNGSGTFAINSTGQPVVSGTVISSSTFNALTADLATGLSTCITKDGQTTVTANIPMNSYKITGLAAGTAATDAARVGQLQAGGATLVTVAGTDTYTGTMSPSLGAYAAGNVFTFVVPNTNTTAATLNIDGLGAKALTRDGSTALVAGDLVANAEIAVVYDGTRFQVLNSNSKTNFNLSGTLTVAGNTTLSGGTANGVAYLNASKVLTTGSALTFDGTNFSGPRLVASSTDASGSVIQVDTTATAYGQMGGSNSMGWKAGSQHIWNLTAGEQMRLTSTGLGIGTSSPSQKLHVAGNAQVKPSTGTDAVWNRASNDSGEFYLGIDNSAGSGFTGTAYARFLYSNGAYPIVFSTSGSERMRLDSSGNLGIGVTPSAWGQSGTLQAIQIKNTAIAGSGTNAYWGSNWFGGGFDKYITTAAASLAVQTGGQHIWYNAPSGTAGNAITFTQAMTLNASGELCIGATSTNLTSGGIFAAMGSGNSGMGIGHVTGTASGQYYMQFSYAGSLIGSISQNGTTAVLYNTSSDRRLKDNIIDADSASELIDAIKVRQFDWKSDGTHQRYGMIAQELHEVAPEAVHSPADTDDMMAVDYSKLVPMLVKEIQSLRVRLNALENK
jgi:hypothetical protein